MEKSELTENENGETGGEQSQEHARPQPNCQFCMVLYVLQQLHEDV
jgi:hypothetical protein